MKKRNFIIILFVVIALLVVFLFVFLNKNNIDYLIFDNTLNLKYDNGKFSLASYDDLVNKTYSSFFNGEFIGYYEIYGIDQNNEFYMTNENNEDAYSFEHPYMFVTNGVEVLEFEENDATIDDLSYLTYDFDKYFIEDIDNLDIFKKISYDIDLDNELEDIYYASYYDMDDDNSFSLVFLVKNNKVYLMGESSLFSSYDEEEAFYSIDNYKLMYLLKIDGSIKMVVGMQSTDITYYQIYSFDNDLIQEYGG